MARSRSYAVEMLKAHPVVLMFRVTSEPEADAAFATMTVAKS